VESRRRLRSFLLGLMAGLPRVNCWTLAEHAGESSPAGMQHFLAGAVWDDDAIRAELRAYVIERLGDPGGVLVIDETGDLKKGIHTVGVMDEDAYATGRSGWRTGSPTMPARPCCIWPRITLVPR
jgi:SRSO17 transposase